MNKMQLVLTSVLWSVCIVGLLIYKQMVFWTGTEVLLKTLPVDPWDIFRGNYVTLRYEISDAYRYRDFFTVKQPEYTLGDIVFVVLDKNSNGVGDVTGISKMKPTGNKLFIRGEVIWDGLEFGIESYFVEEGKGKDIERLRGKDLMVRVVIDKEGRAVIKNLEMDGESL